MIATGVFSYADLAANFNGMRFWNHVLQKSDDVLGKEHNIGPYVKCENNNWIANEENPIDFKNYVDASMDESINCSKFATKAGARKIKGAIARRGFIAEKGNKLCPLEPEKLVEMKNKYKAKSIAHYILNDEGHETVSYVNEF